MRTPVAFVIFNRPDLTERVFKEIAQARPRVLLVVADGPRPDHTDDAEKCAATRAIIERVDWPCDVLKNYSDANLGCGRRPSTGLGWVFEQVEEAIVLEDDCLPHATFFPFCEELLDRYREDERVMHISGDNFLSSGQKQPSSYSFSHYTLSWGWATWRRAFRHYDPDVKLWPMLRDTPWLSDVLGSSDAIAHWTRVFDKAQIEGDRAGYWDFQWLFACWAQRGVSILPAVNLISNMGFGENATHTKRSGDRRANLNTSEMAFPLKHPLCMVRDIASDAAIFDQLIRPQRPRGIRQRLQRKCKDALPSCVRNSLASFRSVFN